MVVQWLPITEKTLSIDHDLHASYDLALVTTCQFLSVLQHWHIPVFLNTPVMFWSQGLMYFPDIHMHESLIISFQRLFFREALPEYPKYLLPAFLYSALLFFSEIAITWQYITPSPMQVPAGQRLQCTHVYSPSAWTVSSTKQGTQESTDMITQEAYKLPSSYKGTATHTEQLLLKTAEKALDKIQHPLIIKTLNKLCIKICL